MSKTLKSNHKRIVLFYTVLSLSVAIELLLFGMNTVVPFNEPTVNAKSKQQGISLSKRGDFAQSDILYYNPGECTISSKKGSISASGDYAKVMQAKNAEESVFNVESSSPWYAGWYDDDEAGMKRLLENYGDLAYQLGDAAGAPWVAILVQMKYEDPSSCCGANNFWGNGCDSSHSSYCGASTIQGENLGEGFVQYGETLSSDWYAPTRGISDPKEYLEKLGPLWVQGDPNGAGYASIEYMKDSIDSLQAYIDSSEGQAIVQEFGNYSGGSSSSSSSSGSDQKVSGSDITWIGDSYSVLAYNDYISKTFSGVDVGPSVGDESSYIQSNKSVSHDGGGPTCLDILENIKDKGELRKYLVFACGTNWGWEDEDITNFENLLKDTNTKAVVVTSKTPNSDYTDSNERLKALADSNNNVYLADWTTVYDSAYFDDGIHPNVAPGYEKWVGVISDALSKANGGSCTTFEGDYPQYNQCGDSRWSSKPYSTDDICGSGCGAASMAMLATVATGQDIFPNDIADLLGNQYYDSTSIGTLDPIVGDHYGFEVEVVNTSGVEDAKDKMRDYLKKGYMIHFTGRGCYPGFIYASGGCTSGHVIGLFDIDENDIVTQANSGMGEVHQKASLDDMANALNFNIFTAIKGSNSGSVTCDTGNTCNDSKSAGAGTQTDKPIGPIHEDSTDIPCDPRTKDLGIRDDAYYNYERYSIRLCSIPNIRMVDTQGDDGDDGYVHVNSRVSGAFYSLSEEHNKRCGNYLEAVDDYRTNAEQQALYDAYLNGTGNLAAVPGSPYSNHQQGLAIDFDTSTYCSNDSSVASGPGGYFELDFLDMFGLEDGRYFSQSENWHVQAKEE